MWIAIGKAAKIYGVSTSTLRRWEREGKMHPEFRTLGGHWRYNLNTLLGQVDPTLANLPINVVGYVRVSGAEKRS